MKEDNQLRTKVQKAYSAAAEKPEDKHHFPVGRVFAQSVGYHLQLLDRIPAISVDAFAGASNVSVFADIPPGATVLDVGCGAGLDTLVAAERTGPKGKVIGIDFSDAMISRVRQASEELGISNVELHQASAENLPIDSGSIDVALVNGIFNLNPAREDIFGELARVVKPGGAAYVAELILREALPPEIVCSEADWFAWIAGAKEGVAFLKEFKAAGFSKAVILRTTRNARSKNPRTVVAEVCARR